MRRSCVVERRQRLFGCGLHKKLTRRKGACESRTNLAYGNIALHVAIFYVYHKLC